MKGGLRSIAAAGGARPTRLRGIRSMLYPLSPFSLPSGSSCSVIVQAPRETHRLDHCRAEADAGPELELRTVSATTRTGRRRYGQQSIRSTTLLLVHGGVECATM